MRDMRDRPAAISASQMSRPPEQRHRPLHPWARERASRSASMRPAFHIAFMAGVVTGRGNDTAHGCATPSEGSNFSNLGARAAPRRALPMTNLGNQFLPSGREGAHWMKRFCLFCAQRSLRKNRSLLARLPNLMRDELWCSIGARDKAPECTIANDGHRY